MSIAFHRRFSPARPSRQPRFRTPRLATFATALAMAVAVLPSPGSAQPCDKDLRPLAGSKTAYQARGNRCEGLFETDISAPTLELMSLTAGAFHYPWKRETRLIVGAPSHVSHPVRIRATAIPLGTFYRMDARLAVGDTLEWPVADVLFDEYLNDRRIGVVGWLEDGSRFPVYVPLRISSEPPPRPGKSWPEVTITLRSSVDVQGLRWRASRLASGRCTAPSDWTVFHRGKVWAGDPITLRLPQQTANSVCIDIDGRDSGSDRKAWAELRLKTAP